MDPPPVYPPVPAAPRLPIAIHVGQEQIPPSGSTTSPVPQVLANGGAGYGPPVLERRTPVQTLLEAKSKDVDLITIPLTNSSWRSRWEGYCLLPPAESPDWVGVDGQGHHRQIEAEQWRGAGTFKRGEVNVTRGEETSFILAHASEWLELDSPVEGIRFDSEICWKVYREGARLVVDYRRLNQITIKSRYPIPLINDLLDKPSNTKVFTKMDLKSAYDQALKQEVAYASHLHISTIIVRAPRRRAHVADYARALNSVLNISQYIRISVRLPISDPNAIYKDTATWEIWDAIRTFCNYNTRLDLTLDLGYTFPSSSSLSRWISEPIRQILIPATAFIPNAKGYPVLSKACQAFLHSIFKLRPTIILSQTTKGLHSSGGNEAYAQYLRYLERRTPPEEPIEQYASAYMDYMQAPLEPLMDNLETETYEAFERDPVKYQKYEEAVNLALNEKPSNSPASVFVVGAGRGPLVTAVLRAAEISGRTVQVTAVEKNPNAFVTLQERKALEWGEAVELVFSDMRSFSPKKGKADIIVSELLGSFGDNELSPECLDGVMRHLKSGGVSIPSSYTSYLSPIATSKLHSEITGSDFKAAEKPYVVMFQSATVLSATGGHKQSSKVAPCWTFDHPRPDVIVDHDGLPITNSHNCRSAQLTFHIPQQSTCHGFAGYFEAMLYGDITISIHPDRYDPEMLSWFPCFFPLREPMYLPANSELDVSIFRLWDHSKRRVWFEWMAEAFLPLSASSITVSASISGPTQSRSRSGTPSSMNKAANGRNTPVSGEGTKSPRPSGSANFASAPSPNPNLTLTGSQSPNSRGKYHSESSKDPLRNSEVSDKGANNIASGAEYPVRDGDDEPLVRVKISASGLHNPNGRTSFLTLT